MKFNNIAYHTVINNTFDDSDVAVLHLELVRNGKHCNTFYTYFHIQLLFL